MLINQYFNQLIKIMPLKVTNYFLEKKTKKENKKFALERIVKFKRIPCCSITKLSSENLLRKNNKK